MPVREGVLFGLGNPLFDISAEVSTEFILEHGLQSNNATSVGEKDMEKYYQMINQLNDNPTATCTAGGSTQNTLRVVQWILKTPNITTFVGAIGDDLIAKILKKKAEDDGVLVSYQEKNFPTGICAVLINGTNRSLCAYTSAAAHFTIDHLDDNYNWSLVEKARFYYVSGFFLAVSPESIKKVAKFACMNNRSFSMNLNASYICEALEWDDILPYVDILFGNETEAQAFSNSHQFETEDIVEIAKKICTLRKKNRNRPRIVIFTQGGSGGVLVATGSLPSSSLWCPCLRHSEQNVQEFPIERIDEKLIVDTNGAGDAFVGGFLSQYIQDKEIDKCVRCGIWAATQIIQRRGCTFDQDVQYMDE